MSEPQVSFVIPSYNSRSTLPLCLHAICGQQTDRPFEVVVADSSDDDTVDALAAVFPKVTWVRLGRRAGPGEARNRGMEAAKAPLVAFVDADVVLHNRWLERALSSLRENVAGICGAVEPYPERNPLGFCLFLIQFSKFLPSGSPRSLDVVPSYAFLIRKAQALAAGGFPEDYPMLEDSLFSKRLSSHLGAPFLFCPDLACFHINRKEWRVISDQLLAHGLWSARARRISQLPGSFLTEHRFAVPLLVPYRLMLILYRTWRWDRLAFAKGLVLTPAIGYGLGLWARSFLRGSAEAHD